MALILEIRDARGVPTWHRLDALPLTIGRGLSNDIIVDDPYLDARHACIALDETGGVAISDLGSLNGLYTNGTRAEATLQALPGVEVRMGRTMLRFRDADEAVAPAIVDDRATPVPTAPAESDKDYAHAGPPVGRSRRISLDSGVLATNAGRLVVVAVMIASYACSAWLGDTTRSSGSTVFTAALAVAAVAFLWAAVWSVAARGADRRHHLLGHLMVISLALIVLLVWDSVNEWLTFLFPDASFNSVLFLVVILAVFAGIIAGHLTISHVMTPARRWRAGLIIAGSAVLLVGLAGIVKDDRFTDVPKFPGVLKPLPAQLVPTGTLSAFSGDVKKLKDDVDETIKKP
jgi:pSer/pThr/pTyr-binding forkhead associated (FHA) protein